MFDGDEGGWKRTPGEINAVEMNVGGIMRKVVSMEFAMNKEIAYRKKLESLQKQNHDDLREPLRTVQGAGSNTKKRQASPTNPSCSPVRHAMKPYIKQAPPQCTRQSNVSFSSPQHPRKSDRSCSFTQQSMHPDLSPRNGGQPYSLQPAESEVIQTCKLCDVVCSGSLNFQQHCQGKKHMAKLEGSKLQKDGLSMETAPVKCEVCQVICMTEENLQQHLLGKKHTACLQAIRITSQRNSSS